MKRLFLSAFLLAACSSGGAASPDAGAATTTPCATLCAAASCPSGCAAMCEAGGTAVPRCQSQYNAVVRCAAASGQMCGFTQGGGPSCATQGQAYTDCVTGGATDAGETPTDAGETPTDAGETPTDTGTATPASIVATWEFSTTAPMFEYRLDIMGGPSTGMLRYQSVNTLSGSGCVTTNEYQGSWALTGSTFTARFDVGTTEVTRCTDSSRDVAQMSLPESNVTSTAADYTGPVTVTSTELAFTMFRGSSMRTFTRSR